MKREGCSAGAILLLGLLAGCGYIGPPMAPTLDIPSDVRDLRAIEYGDKIQVSFTIPDLTTEGLMLKSVRSAQLFAGLGAPPADAQYKVPAAGPGPVEYDEVPVQSWLGKTIILGVRATGPKGRTSGWSNFAQLMVGPPLPVPTDLDAKNLKDGVGLTWKGAGPRYRVLRAPGDGPLEVLGDSDKPEFLDSKAQFGTNYKYRVLTLGSDSYMSVVSDAATVTPVDVFPPDVPTGVAATTGLNTIEVSWDRNTEADFRGYNVVRSLDGGPFEKVADLIEAPNFSDTKVQPGQTYRYQVSAVDLVGNQSDRSAPVAAVLP